MSATTLSASLFRAALPSPFINVRRRFQPLQRRQRQPFTPVAPSGPYRLPRKAHEALQTALGPFRNRQEAFALAVFLARFWTVPNRIGRAFVIDRRALTDHRELGLSEAKVRGAIASLERIGFIERTIPAKGSSYRATEDGLRKRPILFQFAVTFLAIFQAANETRSAQRRPTPPMAPPLLNHRSPERSPTDSRVHKGDLKNRLVVESLVGPLNPLEEALARLREGVIRG